MSSAYQSNEELVALGWQALPASYRMPEVAPTVEEALAWCKQLADSHYENFHVASWFLPKQLRPHFHAIYAYCRVSDDLGDEVGNREQSLALLDLWGRELVACYEGRATHPVFVALQKTIRECAIPMQPFADLLIAFRQDQEKLRFANMREVLDYCVYSANPVGRLVLYACGEAGEEGTREREERFQMSDATCTALQLANFWQDVSVDWKKGRVYIPQEDLQRFGVSDETIAAGVATPEFRRLMKYEVGYARSLFTAGLPLIGKVNRDLALDLDLFSRGGLEILRAIELQQFDVLSSRPAIAKTTKISLAFRAVMAKFLPFIQLGGGAA